MTSLQLSPPAAARELLRRRAARASLLNFTEATTPRWSAGKIHRAICEQLDRVRRKEIDRLMLLCPPQHGKSRITSERFPAFLLGHDPTLDIISASASTTLAEKFGREVRNCISSPEYAALFPKTGLAEDSQAKGLWNTSEGGSYFAAGVGSDIFGRGGMAVVDDPFGSWADAQSDLQRDKVWDWYTGTLYNRIRPGQPIVVIQHRMHEDDLAGRLIARQASGGDKWEIVELPARLDDPPWPERYDREALMRIRDNSDPRKWSALYLQNPTPDEGTFFKREWFEFYDPEKLKEGHAYTTGDFAVTDGAGDFTELATHRYLDGMLYLASDAWYGQTAADEWIERLIDQFSAHKPLCFFGESGPIRRSIEPFLTRRMRERRKFCRLEWLPRPHDKPTMARPLQAMASSKQVRLPDTEYGHHLLAQLLNFPAGKYDDAVDMAALMAMAIDQANPGVASVKTPKVKRDHWDDDIDEPSVSLWTAHASAR
jgi:hypothetical protein